MRNCLLILLELILAFNTAAEEEQSKKEQPLKLAAELADGSRIVGLPEITSIRVRTSFADLNIPLKLVQDLSFDGGKETCVINLNNGDTVTGTLNLKSFGLGTLFGQVTVPLTALKNFSVFSGEKDAGLILYYNFDDDRDGKVSDRSGRGHQGIISGNVLYEKSFKGKAARFTAPNSYIMCPDKELNLNGWKHVTVSAWVCFRAFTSYSCVVSRGEVTGERSGGIAMFAGGPIGAKWRNNVFRIIDGDQAVDASGSGFDREKGGHPTPGRWYHMAGTYDGKKIALYIDGELAASRDVPNPERGITDSPETKLVIGTDGMQSRIISWTDVYFGGLIDEIRMYNRTLSKEQIRALYKESSNAANTSSSSSPPPDEPRAIE